VSEVLCLGISHKTAPVAVRERLALSDTRARELVRACVDMPAVDEAAAISTCNRTEVYLTTPNPVAAESGVLGLLATRAGIRPTDLAESMYSPRNCDAARQLYRVTAGLESMIVGEAEIQGQVRRAHEIAREAETTGPMLNRLFSAALAAGKRVRAETRISEGRASVSSVAVRLAEEILGDLSARHVVVIGAGETSELTAKALSAQGVATVFLANRRADRARSIAQRFGGHVVALDALPEQFERADIVVASTSSPHALVEAAALEQVMEIRDHRPLLLIDIAVPRDIEPACGDLDGVTLYDIDDLQGVAHWMGQQDVRPTIAALREHGRDIVEQVLAENAGRWEGITQRDAARIDAVARAVMQRLLHEPTIRLRESGHGRVAMVRELFGLDARGAAEAEAAPTRDNVRRLRS
jgi:glutamyl-tRNA reductase